MGNSQYNKPYTNEELLEALNRFYNENGRSPQAKDLKATYGYPSYSVYNKQFGSLGKALQLAGLNVNRFVNCSREFLIEKLQEFYKIYGRSPGVRDINKLAEYPGFHNFEYIFGSWNKALEAAGLKVNNYFCYTNEFLISELHRYMNEYNIRPRRKDFDQTHGYPSSTVYPRAFGSWNNALKIAGIGVNTNGRYDYTVNNTCTLCNHIVTCNGNIDDDGNFICKTCWTKTWRKNNYDKFLKSQHKRRGYGFIALNKKYKGSHAHHLWLNGNEALVVYIPNFLHGLHWHNHDKPETMGTINAIALDIWIQESLYKELYLTGDVSGT